MRAMLLAIRQYCETFGQSPHSDVFNSQNEPIVSWRYRVAQFLDFGRPVRKSNILTAVMSAT